MSAGSPGRGALGERDTPARAGRGASVKFADLVNVDLVNLVDLANTAAPARRTLWRAVLALTGGLRVEGPAPSEPCVVVANHSSHADTAVLLAALPARTRPVVVAAADYWFGSRLRTILCRALVGAVPVRRNGGGSADLFATSDFLRSGRSVIVYPEGTRSRDGGLARFRSGAGQLAARAGVPLVPVAIVGTRDLLPAHGGLRRTPVRVRFGVPTRDIAAAREQIEALLDGRAQAGAML